MIAYCLLDSPIGPLTLAADDSGLRVIEFPENRYLAKRDASWNSADHPILDLARTQLGEYFAGQRQTFELPLAPRGTPFQLEVWRALAKIPHGRTWSYGQLARHLGRPQAMRAVGAANGRNPLPIVLPCHRVIGASGALTGFGGGLPTKQFLLELEGALPPPQDLFATR
ncbi:MAG: methylated-DNA--[protein]-cysteine S-methyltransferase [Pseudomonas oryzihabitans]